MSDLASSLPIDLALEPMEAKSVADLPDGPGWQYEPKWDGFRCLVFKAGEDVELKGRSGKSLARFFPDMAAAVRALPIDRMVVDGELVIQLGDALSFDALQMRLHPAASRVKKLAAEHPARFILFDCLMSGQGDSLLAKPLVERRRALEQLDIASGAAQFSLSPVTTDVGKAKEWLGAAGGDLDGVIAKRIDSTYRPGERAMLKVKNIRTADCVVGGFRYERASRQVGSLLLGIYDDAGLLHHVGFTSAISRGERAELTRMLEALVEPPGFTGDAPGGPSRWSTERSADWQPLRPELVVEVRYDHVTGNRFRHGTTLVRWRKDKAPAQCTFEQLEKGSALPWQPPD
ncbi:MAG: ATP-dependent DNA ligase [Aestuariivirgaceae bacterium]